MNITSADFFCSYSSLSWLSADGSPEIVFVGRSHVGKFSLLNSLCGRKGQVVQVVAHKLHRPVLIPAFRGHLLTFFPRKHQGFFALEFMVKQTLFAPKLLMQSTATTVFGLFAPGFLV
ncbi:hypothetical protein [Chlorobaculum sp. 24CR]|uniref:hypothetical protein n=1 Tax=Chlorobaculum sp. 24CR TaxID=2508878 RepID=UPI0026B62457